MNSSTALSCAGSSGGQLIKLRLTYGFDANNRLATSSLLRGSDANDYLNGGDGNDVLEGLADVDAIEGATGMT